MVVELKRSHLSVEEELHAKIHLASLAGPALEVLVVSARANLVGFGLGKSGGVGLDLTADAILGIAGADFNFTVDPKDAEEVGGTSNVTALCLLGVAPA